MGDGCSALSSCAACVAAARSCSACADASGAFAACVPRGGPVRVPPNVARCDATCVQDAGGADDPLALALVILFSIALAALAIWWQVRFWLREGWSRKPAARAARMGGGDDFDGEDEIGLVSYPHPEGDPE